MNIRKLFTLSFLILSVLIGTKASQADEQSVASSFEDVSDPLTYKYLATPSEAAKSPSGEFELRVLEGFDGEAPFQRFQILGKTKKGKGIVYNDAKDFFYSRHTTYFFWDAENRAWVYSGDIGTFYWERDKLGLWRKHTYDKTKMRAPEFLRRAKPHFFPK
jgi:hypothetical protein